MLFLAPQTPLLRKKNSKDLDDTSGCMKLHFSLNTYNYKSVFKLFILFQFFIYNKYKIVSR